MTQPPGDSIAAYSAVLASSTKDSTLRCMLPSRTKISRFYFATYHVRFFLFKQGTLEYESIHRGHSYCLAMRWRLMMMLLPPPRLPSDESESGLVDGQYVDPVRLSVARTCTVLPIDAIASPCHVCSSAMLPCRACSMFHVPALVHVSPANPTNSYLPYLYL